MTTGEGVVRYVKGEIKRRKEDEPMMKRSRQEDKRKGEVLSVSLD